MRYGVLYGAVLQFFQMLADVIPYQLAPEAIALLLRDLRGFDLPGPAVNDDRHLL